MILFLFYNHELFSTVVILFILTLNVRKVVQRYIDAFNILQTPSHFSPMAETKRSAGPDRQCYIDPEVVFVFSGFSENKGTKGILSLAGSHDTLISYLDNLHFGILCK